VLAVYVRVAADRTGLPVVDLTERRADPRPIAGDQCTLRGSWPRPLLS
jgi:hypothetical protein